MRKPGSNIANTVNLALANSERYNNCGLFADNYLKSRINDLADWRKTPGLDAAFEAIKKLYSETREALANSNEAQTEAEFIRPILDLLWVDDGRCWDVQVIIPALGGRGKQPDYALFRTAADRNSAGQRKGTQDYWRDVPCLGDAKGWNISLDKDRARGENPSAQMSDYLYRSRVRWGILTNGRQWRLYEQDKSRAGGVFFEVDLQVALEHNDRDTFRWFYYFFRRAAFVPDAEGKTFVDAVFQGSVDYATDVGDRLKDSVYDALSALMNGFFDRASNHLDRHDEVTLRTVHDNALLLLYRLLFILYAEDRELLPLKNDHYQTYALVNTHRKVNLKLRAEKSYPRQTAGLWADLLNLFLLIDEPDPASGIPAFNGGLFSPARHPHIAHTPQPDCLRWEIGDDALALAIDMLAYKRDRWNVPGSQDVDYKSLDVQHLGSIYEGLLELQPEVAKVPLVEVSEKGKLGFEPEAKVKKPGNVRGQTPRSVPKDAVYLVTNRGERKATGSYYTPKYIVDYIIDNTVGPLVEEAGKKVAELRGAVDKRIAELEKTTREWEKSEPKDDSTQLQIKKLRQEADRERRKLLEPYLSLAILDPAMGSGHFLVGAADFLSLAMATDPNLLPLEANGSEDEQAYYKRLVVEHCLYGVDLNPLAVELAKLSLWLHTVSKNKALSFLDHHLRCGNSLIGASVDTDLTREPPQFSPSGKLVNGGNSQLILGFSDALTATHLQSFLDIFKEISESTGGTVEIERHKAEIYEKMDEVRDRFRAVANCWIAPYFGQPVSPKQYERAVDALKDANKWESLKAESWFRHSRRLVAPKRPFHWQLEFPERFFSHGGLKPEADRGFDAVIGNPPYVSFGLRGTGTLTEMEKVFFQSAFRESAEYKVSMYAMFMEHALGMVTQGGRHSFIVPDSFLLGRYFSRIRKCILYSGHLKSLVLIHEDFWASGTVGQPTIYVVQRAGEEVAARPNFVHTAIVETLEDFAQGITRTDCIPQAFFQAAPLNRIRMILGEDVRNVIRLLEANGTQLSAVVKFYSGLIGKNGQSTIEVDEMPVDYSPERYGRLVSSSGNLDRYALAYDGQFCPKLPALYKSGFTPGIYEAPKLFLNQTGDHLRCCYDADGYYCLNNMHAGYPVDPSHSLLYVNALICSRVMHFYYRQVSLEEGRANAQTDIDVIDTLPIWFVSFITSVVDRTRFIDDFKRFFTGCAIETVMLSFVQDHLSAKPQRADVVHDILAFLAGEMIEMNKSKQEEVKGFLTWLAGYIGCPIEDLTNKTKVKEYHGSDFDSLAAVLAQNGKKLTVSPEARATIETIKPEFEKSVAKLEPLKARIVATDDLIDEIVYKLYGLTEEEIRIVKGV